MSLLNQNKVPSKTLNNKSSKDNADFSKVGGLDQHLKTLREVIIFPLLHGNVFSYFSIKAPRGVLFYGPPGTGKTLVAGALATEINREGLGKVSFFQRKGADVLDKWVGESEKKLKELFEKAAKSRPSIIFFDELDGLAPVRSPKNDHIHSSIVATLLALMDGLDNKPGVIVIGATNRIETIDPALRRTGRFDKELYFPMPATEARRQILQVHTQSWKNKPRPEFLSHMAELTGGFSGSDLQALCCEAVLCCMRRTYPNMSGCKVKIEAESLKVDECDFLQARFNLLPAAQKFGCKVRHLNSSIEPLLVRQLNNVVTYIHELWPYFLQENYKYITGDRRYAGRMVLLGKNQDGLNTHLVPAILHKLEHLPVFLVDASTISERSFPNVRGNLPSILLLSRVDDWWELLDEVERLSIVTSVEDLHAGLPVLIMVTVQSEVPSMEYFYNSSSILLKIEKPNKQERENFFYPLFFDENFCSVYFVLETESRFKNLREKKTFQTNKPKSRQTKKEKDKCSCGNLLDKISNPLIKAKKRKETTNASMSKKKLKICKSKIKDLKSKSTGSGLGIGHIKQEILTDEGQRDVLRRDYGNEITDHNRFAHVLADLISPDPDQSNFNSGGSFSSCYSDMPIKVEPTASMTSASASVTSDVYREETRENQIQKIYNLWQRTSWITSNQMSVSHLELLYDVIRTCIKLHKNSFSPLIQCRLTYVHSAKNLTSLDEILIRLLTLCCAC